MRGYYFTFEESNIIKIMFGFKKIELEKEKEKIVLKNLKTSQIKNIIQYEKITINHIF